MGLAACTLASVVVALVMGPSAFATTVTNQRPLLFSFDGSDTAAGRFTNEEEGFFGVAALAVDRATGSIYVADGGNEAVDKFNAEGKAENFVSGPSAGSSSLLGPSAVETFGDQSPIVGGRPSFFRLFPSLAVDNSGGLGGVGEGEQGRLYVGGLNGPIDAFDNEGNFLWTLPREEGGEPVTEGACGMTVDSEGHLWVAAGASTDAHGYREKVVEFDTTGSSLPSTTPIGEISITSGVKQPCGLAIDHDGEALYVAQLVTGLDKYIGGSFDATILAASIRGVAIDGTHSGGHIFAIQDPPASELFPYFEADAQDRESALGEYEPCASPGCGATLVKTFGAGLVGDGRGIAYDSGRDWVYVSDIYSQTVKVFGPTASGTAPDVKAEETDGITRTEATAHGTINPLGTSNRYHFERIRGEAQRVGIEATGGSFFLAMTSAIGSGEITAGSNVVTGVQTAFGAFDVGDTISASGNYLPGGLTITGVGAETLTLSANAAQTQDAVGLIDTATTAPIAWDAPASGGEGSGSVEAALEALPIAAGNISVTGKSAAGGEPGEYLITFENELAGHNLREIAGDSSDLTGGAQQVAVRTVTEGQSWAAVSPQPGWPESSPSIEPTDSVDHPVSAQLTSLRPNTTYDVRLVGTNTEPEGDPEKRLHAYSNIETFTTLPPDPPVVSNLSLSGVTTDSAHLSATIDPQKDETTWRVLVSGAAIQTTTNEECEGFPQSAFEALEEGTIPAGEPGTFDLETDLTGLKSGEIYCLRLIAANGNPDSGVASTLLQTVAVAPTEVKLGFAAPRTATSARLNFYVNPEGETPLTYQLEYSADGTSWMPLKELVSTIDAHNQIILSDELTGLAPGTTYFYRLGLVENEVEELPQSALGPEKEFTTRTELEMTLPANAFGEPERRGIELVNSPDTGNQNARAAELYSDMSPLRTDGEEFLWTVLGGAPNANSGTQATFLATRTTAGWASQSLVPPASQQVGGGGLTYFPVAASPDFSSFIFGPAEPAVLTTGPPTFVRLDAAGNQQVLHVYESPVLRVDATADTAHVLIVDPDTGRLEDIGSGSPEEIGLIPSPSAPPGVPQPGGSPPACGLNAEGGSFFGGGGNGAAAQYETGYHRMSVTDASRVYFQVHPDSTAPACTGAWALYERNREASPPTTTPIVVPGQATADTAIIRATPDGRSVYFVTSASLHAVDANGHPDVYRWDESTLKSTCLTCGVKNEAGKAVTDANLPVTNGNVARVLISDDFSHIYFNSESRLIADRGVEGKRNLYVLSGGKIRFVASSVPLTGSEVLSTDGNVLTFLSDERLTSDSVAAQCPKLDKAGAFGPCQELYLYDDRTGSIECISCRLHATTTNSVSLTGFGDAFQTSADGGTVAFTTVERLVPTDVNNGADLYEWRSGAIRLITDGVTRYPIGYAAPIPQGVDADGSNIVFSVAAPRLTGFERNGLANLYNARIGGGFTPPSPAGHCAEESCQGPLQGAPAVDTPLSSSYRGSGNPLSRRRRCRRPKVRRHGRCVKRPQRHRKHGQRRAGGRQGGGR
jgi:hypothetical protein